MRIAVIPARGGSKRIPRKNIKMFGGKPIIAYSIDCAISSGLFDRVIVSTDDPEIASVAERYGAEAPFSRPAELSDDRTGTTEVVAHAVRQVRREDRDVTAVCCIYATAPFILADDLYRGWKLMETGAWKYVFSATTYPSPIFRAFENTDAGSVKMFYPEFFEKRSQDLPEAWHDAAQFYWGQPSAWLENAKIFAEHSAIIPIPRWRVQDIDTPEDWIRAELLAPNIFMHEQRVQSIFS
jgi:pseudaminic acid cytidylyltransferase